MVDVVWLDACGSTNDEAWRRADTPGFRAVAAKVQTQGRGRRGRTWHSPADHGLYLTWIARPTFSQALGSALPLLAAVAAAECCEAWGVECTLKWPNDVLVGTRKLAGILCEARGTPDAWRAAVGLGLNLRRPAEGYPPQVPGVALDELGVDVDPEAAAAQLVSRFEAWLVRVTDAGMAPVIEGWARYAPGPETTFRQAGFEGRFDGLAPDGALRLRGPDGVRLIHAGEVEMLRTLPPQNRS